MSRASRQDTYSVGVAIDGVDHGVWDKMTGGEVDSDETKYKPGGMQPEVSLGGSKSVGNITISRLYDLDRDHTVIKTLLSSAGTAEVTVTKQPLDVNAVPYGAPLVYTGKLKQVTPPEVDSESSDAGLVEIEVSSAGVVA